MNFRSRLQYDADGADKTYYVKHDERWRIVGVFRENDTSAKETFVYHNAGASGYGGSSYIDDCILRDRDHNSGWTSAADGTLEQRRYYCQNWRHDVVAMIKSDGKIAERDRYLSYGTPFGSPLADATFDGTVSASDTTQVNTDWGANYHVRSDFNLDGAVGGADSAEVTANSGKTLGWGTLSDATNVASRKGFAGHEIDSAVSKLSHVRNRATHTELGRTLSRTYFEYAAPQAATSTGPSPGDDCEGRIDWCMANVASIKALVEQIKHGCGIDYDLRHLIRCGECNGSCGYFEPNPPGALHPEIPGLICISRDQSNCTGGICSTVLHELHHILQLCKYKSKWPHSWWPQWLDPYSQICMELDACRRSLQCGGNDAGSCCDCACASAKDNFDELCDNDTCLQWCYWAIHNNLCEGAFGWIRACVRPAHAPRRSIWEINLAAIDDAHCFLCMHVDGGGGHRGHLRFGCNSCCLG